MHVSLSHTATKASVKACQPIQAVTLRPGVPVVCTQAISHAAKSSAISVVVAGMALAGFIDAKCAMAYDMAASEGLFTSKCAGCHQNGGNVVAGNATLFPDDLLRNGINGPDDLYRIIYSGKGKMPGYGADCAPRGACTFGPRLADDEIRGLATYVQEQAELGWGKPK